MAVPYQDLSPVELDELLSAILPDIPGCRVLRLLGRGGMSYVYLGIQEALDRQVAIKVMSPLALEDEVSRQRFEKEARTIAKLQHPGIVGIHAVGRTDLGLSYYVMPYLSRGHLGLRDLRRDEVKIMAVLRSLLGALDYAHAQGVVHRDVKAENVLFDHDDRPLLTDFGIAISKRDHARMTGNGNAVGSWAYMAPEQARGEQVDGRADLYSVGVLTYEMLCGQLPYHDEDSMALALMHALDPIPRLPPGKTHWQGLIDRAMAKTPGGRYPTAREMLADLDRIALRPHPIEVTEPATRVNVAKANPRSGSPGTRSATWKTRASSGRLSWLLAAVGLIALLAVGLLFWPRLSGPDEPAQQDETAIADTAPRNAVASGDQVAANVATAPDMGVDELADTPLSDTDASDPDAFVVPDDLPPGEAELLLAQEQIRRRRLTQPRGESALDALLEARRILGSDQRVTALGERWLEALQPYVVTALEKGEDTRSMSLLETARHLEETLGLGQAEAWQAFTTAVAEPVHGQLRQAHADKDLAALRTAKQRAGALGIEPARLEPEYSRPVVLAKVGDAWTAGNSTLALVRLPEGQQPGLAMLPTVVTQQQYGEFARASGRAASQCRIRTASVTVRRRSWSDPGFAQTGDHPVVCVSLADAKAYAAWLGQRDGVTYRLPTNPEWRAATGAPANAVCGQSGVSCRTEGTTGVGTASHRPNGVASQLGNVREWPSDCADCREHPTLGLGWRDASAKRQAEMVDPTRGYDDIGFRLVLEIPREAVEKH